MAAPRNGHPWARRTKGLEHPQGKSPEAMYPPQVVDEIFGEGAADSIANKLGKRQYAEQALSRFFQRNPNGAEAACFVIEGKPGRYAEHTYVIPAGGKLPSAEFLAETLRYAMKKTGFKEHCIREVKYSRDHVYVSQRSAFLIASVLSNPSTEAQMLKARDAALNTPSQSQAR